MRCSIKFFLVIVFCTSVVTSYGVTIKEQVALNSSRMQYAKIYDLANKVYKGTTDYSAYTIDELYILSLASSVLYLDGDTIVGQQYAQAPAKWFLNKYSKISETFPKLSIEKKKEVILDLFSDYSACKVALLIMKRDYAKQASTIYHNVVVKNRNLFMNESVEDLIVIPRILAEDVMWMQLYERSEIALNTYFPEMMILPQKCKSSQEKKVMALAIDGALKVLQPEILRYIFIKQKGTNEHVYISAITDFLLVQQELELYISGHEQSADYYEISWKRIQQALSDSEAAVLMFQTNIVDINLEGYIKFNKIDREPQHSILRMGEIFKQPIDFSSIQKERIFVSVLNCFENYNEDIAYTSQNVYLKYSLADIIRNRTKTLCGKYNNGQVEIMADINYNPSSKLPILQSKKRLINNIKKYFPEQAYVLSGDNVRKINFMNISKDIEILHLSTHGIIAPMIDKPIYNSEDVYNHIVGKEDMDLLYLCLSNYKGVLGENTLSAKDIASDAVSMEGVELVFLDACNTSYASNTTFSGLVSIAKACYIAGANNVISFLSPINEEVATDFAISFYNTIATNPDITYHEAFYITKKEMIEKYAGTAYMPTDQFNRPRFDIVLWE